MSGPSLNLTNLQARRFLLAHHGLWPPRKLKGKDGARRYVESVGAIQFDPINVVGRNPDLVLQSRVQGYRPEMLHELLYADRLLMDGWDKVASIYLSADWPYFKRHRDRMRAEYDKPSNPPMQIADEILQSIKDDGPKSPIDFKRGESITWSWGVNTSLPRACLEILYAMGELVVYDRVGTRRTFELAARALPETIYAAPDPNSTEEQYQDWHVLRRIGSLGLANPGAGDWWLGMHQMRTPQHGATLKRLIERGEVVEVEIGDLPNRRLLMRAVDLPILDQIRKKRPPKPRAAVIGALDNIAWDRNMLRWLFGFDYVWEVYKPQAQRLYGYYVLPVLYGDRFIARWDPIFNREEGVLTINNWWWEEGVEVKAETRSALIAAFKEFSRYLQAERVLAGTATKTVSSLDWIQEVKS